MGIGCVWYTCSFANHPTTPPTKNIIIDTRVPMVRVTANIASSKILLPDVRRSLDVKQFLRKRATILPNFTWKFLGPLVSSSCCVKATLLPCLSGIPDYLGCFLFFFRVFVIFVLAEPPQLYSEESFDFPCFWFAKITICFPKLLMNWILSTL